MRIRWMVMALALAWPGLAAASWEGDVTRGYAEVPGGQVHYRMATPGEMEPGAVPILALPLVPASAQVFVRWMEVMGRERPVLAFDLPGYGMSDPLPDPQTIPAYAERMVAALTALGHDRADLVGYHTGAAVAAAMALQAPERFAKILMVAPPLLNDEERAAGAALPPIPFDEAGAFAQAEWQRTRRWLGPGQSLESGLRTFADKMRPGVRDRGAKAVLAYDMQAALEALRARRHDVSFVRVRDDLWEAAGRLPELWPGAPYRELPQYGHGLFEVAAEEMAEITRWAFD